LLRAQRGCSFRAAGATVRARRVHLPGIPDALDTQAVEHTARRLLDARINAVRELAKAQVAVAHARDALAAAETNHAAVHTAATRAGWNDTELKQIGLATPARRTPGRPRRARSSAPRTTPSPATSRAAESPNLDADHIPNRS
jgi:hypothetical protein